MADPAYKAKPMTERELETLIDAAIRGAIGYHDTEISEEQQRALEYYYGEQFGDEVEGYSSVVSRDVLEVVEAVKPDIIRTFTAHDDFVRFEPESSDDVEQAEQETKYVNYAFKNDCNGFLTFYEWITDAALQKNGVVKVWWEDYEDSEREEYDNLTEEELAYLDSQAQGDGAELEIDSQEMRQEAVIGIAPDGLTEIEVQPATYHVVLHRKRPSGKLQVHNVPPEEFLIDRDAPSLDPQEAKFVAHRRKWTVSELREAGYPEDLIREAGRGDERIEWDDERITRREDEQDWYGEDQYAGGDGSRREVWVTECYTHLDWDGDGIAELRKVTRAGEAILDNEEIDRIPFHALSLIPLPHKYYGMSLADLAMDIQRIRSVLWRQGLDNLYLTNHGRPHVNERVNLDDLLDGAPGKPVRHAGTSQPQANYYMDYPQGQFNSIHPMLEYTQQVRDERTGVGKESQGMDPDTLQNTNTGTLSQAIEQAKSRIELMIRCAAETGVKSLFRHVHELLRKNQQWSRTIRMQGEWAEVTPAQWRRREHMTVTVGLGTGSRDERRQNLGMIAQMQEKLLPFGGVGYDHAYETAQEMASIAGYKDATRFFRTPDEVQQAQAQQQGQDQQDDPYVALEAQKNQNQAQKDQMEMRLKLMQQQFEQQRKAQELALKQQEQQFEQMMKRMEQGFEAHKFAEQQATERTGMELKHDQDVPGSEV
jgi:hypothetical protein